MPRRKSAAQVKAECPTCNPRPEAPPAIPIGEPGNRVCEMCGWHEVSHPDLQWTQTPQIRHHKEGPEKGLLNICTDCWDDITMDMRAGLDEALNEIEGLRKDMRKGPEGGLVSV